MTVVLIIGASQLQVSSILSGELPLRVALALNRNVLPFLAAVLVICLGGLMAGLLRNMSPGWRGLLWLI